LTSNINKASVAGALCALLLIACDTGRCVRNSDCNRLRTCVLGYCVIKPIADSGVTSIKDAASKDAKSAADVYQKNSPSSDSGEVGFFDMDAE
jgi:hypothetical protein